MFKKLLQIFKGHYTKDQPSGDATHITCNLSFFGLKISLTNARGIEVIIVIVFLIAVILIVLLARDYISHIRFSLPKKITTYL